MQSEWQQIISLMSAIESYEPKSVQLPSVGAGSIVESDAVEFLRRMADNSVDLIFTDEPYGIKPTALSFSGSTGSFYEHVAVDWDNGFPAHMAIPWVAEAARVLKEGGMLINSGFPEWSTTFKEVVRMSGLFFKGTIAWIKPNSGTQVRKVNYKSAHETFWWAVKGKVGNSFNFLEQQEMRNWVAETICPKCRTFHPVLVSNQYGSAEWMEDVEWPLFLQGPGQPGKGRTNKTQKPEWLARKFLTVHSNKLDLVVDPFFGSGTYLAVAHEMGREVAGCDMREDQVAATIKRIQSTTLSFM